jgi:hypothetical protein
VADPATAWPAIPGMIRLGQAHAGRFTRSCGGLGQLWDIEAILSLDRPITRFLLKLNLVACASGNKQWLSRVNADNNDGQFAP